MTPDDFPAIDAEQWVLLSDERLKGLRWDFPSDFSFAANWASVPLVGSEILRAAHEYPLVFAHHGPSFTPAALLSLPKSKTKSGNSFLSSEGQWLARYRPFHVRIFPFATASESDSDDLHVHINAECVGPAGRYAFCQGSGVLTPETEKIAVAVRKAFSRAEDLAKAIEMLAETGVLVPLSETYPLTASNDDAAHLRVVAPHLVAERLGTDAADWYDRAPLALELAFASEFSYLSTLGVPAVGSDRGSQALEQPSTGEGSSSSNPWMNFDNALRF